MESAISFKEAKEIIINTPSNDSIRDYLYKYTSESHLAGTESDKAQAEWTRDKFIEFGISDSKIETYWPLLNYPKYRRVAIVSGPEKLRYEAKLREDIIDEDGTSKGQDDVPTFHGKPPIRKLSIRSNTGRRIILTYSLCRIFRCWQCDGTHCLC